MRIDKLRFLTSRSLCAWLLAFAVAGGGCATAADLDQGSFASEDDSELAVDVLAQEEGPAPTMDSASKNGPYQVKTYTSGYRNGPKYADSTIHYPEGAPGVWPAVTVVPGFVSPQSSIKTWGPFLASHGIITMTIGTNSTSDPPQSRSAALLDALETIRTEDVRMGGPLNGKVDTSRLGVMGWSMGGGGSLIAANSTPALKAAISMCGWNPGARYAQMKVPSLMFAATSDPLAGGQSQGFYASIPESTPKMIFEVQGGSHNVANSPRGHGGKVGLFGLSWLKIHLVGDDRYKSLITSKPSGLATFKTNLQ
jgi:dienelactone hydrolase